MADKTPDLSEIIKQAAHHPKVREALEAQARLLLPRAQRIAAEAGALEFGKALRVEIGVRPGTKAKDHFRRPYARIIATVTEEMKTADRRQKMSRTKILRRAAAR